MPDPTPSAVSVVTPPPPAVDRARLWEPYPLLAAECAAASVTGDWAEAWLYAGLESDLRAWAKRIGRHPSAAYNQAEKLAAKLQRFYGMFSRKPPRPSRTLIACFNNVRYYRDHGPLQGLEPTAAYGELSRAKQQEGEPHPLAHRMTEVSLRCPIVTEYELEKSRRVEENRDSTENGLVWAGTTVAGDKFRLPVPDALPLTFLGYLARSFEPALSKRHALA